MDVEESVRYGKRPRHEVRNNRDGLDTDDPLAVLVSALTDGIQLPIRHVSVQEAPPRELGSAFTCERCEIENAFISDAWHRGTEPSWFYDLHALLRNLLAQNGDVPLLLADRLRKEHGTYSDLPEVEFFTDRGDPEVEIDLFANVAGRVVVAEAKSNGDLGSLADAAKLALAASLVTADEVVLATTASEWSERSRTNLVNAVSRESWMADAAPRLRLLAGLGRQNITDIELLASHSGPPAFRPWVPDERLQ